MEKLKNLLRQETHQLKLDYIEKTIQWANQDFDKAFEKSRWNEEQWCKWLGIDPETRKTGDNKFHITFPKGFYNTSKAKELNNEQTKIRNILRVGKSEYISKSIKAANKHYEDSVNKLSDRIVKKGMNTEMISIKSSYINHNLEASFTDGEKSVRAFTVLAFGPIQRPHYRYLIK